MNQEGHDGAPSQPAAASPWQPDQYNRYHHERARPFYDLLAMVAPCPGGRVLDLGCGTGELTRELHQTLGAAKTLGVDRSETMLAASSEFEEANLEFVQADIADLQLGDMTFDVVLSNAALQWVDDHATLWPKVASRVSAGGQLAIQIPANHDHPSHIIAAQVASDAPFADALGGFVRRSPVLTAEEYAVLMYRCGFVEQRVALNVVAHELPSRSDVIEWVKGTLLTGYQRRMSPALFAHFLAVYEDHLFDVLPDERPFFYPFKRILMWGRR